MKMENHSTIKEEEEQMELPPGFRFHPTDEELITFYLSEKVLNTNFSTIAIGEADLNKVEPWDLPKQAKIGEKEWYFFVVRDRKYPTGLRTNRATEAGYWKATGKDKEIYKGKALVGMKKTLVFYTGRAPKGEKTNWVMHEYRLEGKYSKYNLPKNSKNDWVISRVFNKSSGAKKTNVAEMERQEEELPTHYLPPLMDSSPCNNNNNNSETTNLSHVTCFSNACVLDDKPKQEDIKAMFGNTCSTSSTALTTPYSPPFFGSDYQFVDSLFGQDQSMLKLLLQGKVTNSNNNNSDFSGVMDSNHEIINNLSGPIEHDSFWDY